MHNFTLEIAHIVIRKVYEIIVIVQYIFVNQKILYIILLNNISLTKKLICIEPKLQIEYSQS